MKTRKKIQITLSVDATERYLELAEAKSNAEAEADIDNSGTCIVIDTWVLGSTASFKFGEKLTELGDAELCIKEAREDND